MLHQVGVSFDLYYDARKHKIKICTDLSSMELLFCRTLSWAVSQNTQRVHSELMSTDRIRISKVTNSTNLKVQGGSNITGTDFFKP